MCTSLSPCELPQEGGEEPSSPVAGLARPWASLLLSWHQTPYLFNFYFKSCWGEGGGGVDNSFQISLALLFRRTQCCHAGKRQHQLEEQK